MAVEVGAPIHNDNGLLEPPRRSLRHRRSPGRLERDLGRPMVKRYISAAPHVLRRMEIKAAFPVLAVGFRNTDVLN